MVEQPLADGIKHLLEHPIWSQRVTILRGSPLRASDLARAKSVIIKYITNNTVLTIYY